jgi:hypothetical protein
MNENKPCFIIIPIGEENSSERDRSDQIFKYILEPVLNANGYNAIRADHINQPGQIGTQVIKHIIEDELVIADLTNHNPNVFYELAIRHTIGKPVIQIIDIGTSIPFDVAQSRMIKFDYKNLGSVAECKDKICEQIKSINDNSDNIDNPVRSVIDRIEIGTSTNPTEKLTSQIFDSISELNDKVSEINNSIFCEHGFNNIQSLLSGDFVQAEYIDGEKEAFEALTKVTKEAKEIIRSTRFFPGSVLSQPEYIHAMEQRVTGNDGRAKLRHYYRIVAVNDESKQRDINHHLNQFFGFSFELYLTHHENTFELVIVDEADVFIHFYKEEKVVSSALHIKGKTVVCEFIEIFNKLKDRDLIEKFDLTCYDQGNILEAQTRVNQIFGEKFNNQDSELQT